MSSPEVERFEISQDDLENEFNPNRKRFKMSKNQAVYGIWADPDSDEERPVLGRGGRHAKDYTAPVNFISGGVKVGDKVTKNEPKEGEEDEQDANGTDSDDEFDRATISKSFGEQFKSQSRGKSLRTAMGNVSLGKGSRGKASGSNVTAFGNRKHGDDDFGNWERHTKGIGMKLLEKMGHVAGRGLGKNLQGITLPVEAVQRKGKATLGFYGPGSERSDRSLKDFPKQADSEEEEDAEFQTQLRQWKKGEGEKKKKPKYNYKTADELISTGGRRKQKSEVQSELSKVKVIDMTGREQRVLSGYYSLRHKHDRPEDEEEEQMVKTAPEKKIFDMPELLHNLDLLVDMAEEAIIENDRKLRYGEDMVVNLAHEKTKLGELCEREAQQMERLKEVLAILDDCQQRGVPGAATAPLTLDHCAAVFKQLQDDYYEEYKLFELSQVAVALVFPLMKREFDHWDPLSQPLHGMETVTVWKGILEGMGQPLTHGDTSMDPYDRLIWEVWMPHIRAAVASGWKVRDGDSLIELLEHWMPILPEWVMSNVLEQIVFPKLNTEVEAWNPLTDTMPIHAWLHPWLPLMVDRLEPLYGPIRHKLANALTNWHPSDPSAKMILEPWMKVFTPGHMSAFIMKNIVPKLALCMQEFLINPHEQHLDAWNWVMSWRDVAPQHALVGVLEKNFFPRWLQVLSVWLTSQPNYNEVTKWYQGWKSMFSPQLLADGVIKDQFNKALEMMNRAVAGHFQPGARESVAYLTSTERRKHMETAAATPAAATAVPEKREYDMARAASATGSMPTSFKDLIQRRAEDLNILFVPIPSKTYEGKQTYRFGKTQVYIDRNVVYMFDNNKWVPVSLNMLVDRSR